MRRRDFLGVSAATAIAFATRNAFSAPAANENASATTRPDPPGSDAIPVAIAISAGTTNMDWVGPEAVFQTWHFDPVLKQHRPRFRQFFVSEKLEPVSHMVPDFTYDTMPSAKIIVVPNQRGSAAMIDWLRKMSQSAELIMSVCTGARHLAAAGLLDGKSATTHHEAIDDFAQRYPKVNWVKGVRFVEHEKLCTGGGLTAGIDLALRIRERYFGREEAQMVAEHLEYQGKGWVVS